MLIHLLFSWRELEKEMKKKILLLCIVYCMAICTAIWTEALLAESIVLFCVFVFIFAYVRKCVRLPFVAVALGVFILGFSQTQYKNNISNYIPSVLNGLTVNVRGSVQEVVVYEDYSTYILKPNTMYIRLIDGGKQHFKIKGKLAVSVEECDAVRKTYDYGDCIEVRGTLEFVQTAKSSSEFDYGLWRKADGIYATMYVKEIYVADLQETDVNPVLLAASRIRKYILDTIQSGIGGDAGALLSGILINERSAFSPAFEQALQMAGLSHICSVSGMHISILCSLLMWLFVHLRLRRRFYYPLCALALHFFAWIAGSGVSVMRAVLMFDMCMLAYWTRGDEDRPFTCLCVGFLMLIAQPLYLFNTGFLLSFASVFGILFLGKRMEGFLARYIRIRPLRSVVVVSLCAQIFTLPILAESFHTVSVYALLYNILLTWLVAPLMIVAAVYLIVSAFWMAGAQVIGFLLEVVLHGMCAVILTVKFLPFHALSIAGGITFPLFYYAFIGLLYGMRAKKDVWVRSLKWIVCICMIAFSISNCVDGYTARVHFLDVGEGDAALIQLPLGINVLIDAGGSSFGARNTGDGKVVAYLRSLGVSKIDYAIVSHYDSDHAQGMISVCENLRVQRLILPYRKTGYTEIYKTALEEIAQKRKIKVQYTRGGETLKLPGGLKAEILSPDEDMLAYCASENDLSLVMRLTYGKFRMLFTGDMQMLAENRLLAAKVDVRADLLKVAHHGSDTSSSDYFIDAVAPQVAVISSGNYSYNGHPAPRTLVTLKRIGALTDRTALSGDLVYEIRKSGAWRISRE